jgi:hypothetical protein
MWWLVTIGCTTAPEPEGPDRAAACGRMYGSTTDTLASMYAASTEPEPRFSAKGPWVERCLASPLTAAHLRCADPKIEMFDPGCAAVLEPVRDHVQLLQDALIESRSPP